jgi:outer membrane protein OmpA-like peptidoglycan-associated protein
MSRTVVLCFISLSFVVKINAQNSSKDSVRTAPVEVTVVDGKKMPRIGEKVIFTGKKSGQFFEGRTDKKGQLSIALPAGDEYGVVLSTLTDSSRYGTLPIAPLTGNQFYKKPFSIEITYEPAKTFTLNDVHFDFGSAILLPRSFKQLEELYEYLKWKENCRIEVAGHTDDVGQDSDNMILSQKRAESVKTWLVKKGIESSRIIAKGYGSTQPVADNSNEEGRQRNRRTEVRIL